MADENINSSFRTTAPFAERSSFVTTIAVTGRPAPAGSPGCSGSKTRPKPIA